MASRGGPRHAWAFAEEDLVLETHDAELLKMRLKIASIGLE